MHTYIIWIFGNLSCAVTFEKRVPVTTLNFCRVEINSRIGLETLNLSFSRVYTANALD